MNPQWSKPRPEKLPAPSYAPALMALGLFCLLCGMVTSWIISMAGMAIMGIAGWQWLEGPADAVRVAAKPVALERSPRRRSAEIAARGGGVPGWYPMVLAAFTLVLVVLGAATTSQQPGFALIHGVAGAATGVLTLGLALWASRAEPRAWLRRLCWMLVASVPLEAVVRGTLHAFLAQLFFASTVAISVGCSRSWQRDPELVEDTSRPACRHMSLVMVGLVVGQVALGAAVRHKALGPMLHILGALVVALAILLVGVVVMNQCPTHRILRPLAILMMTITGIQVFLGFAAFIVRMMAEATALPVVISTVAHVTTGALTLGATVVALLQIRRHMRPAETQITGATVP